MGERRVYRVLVWKPEGKRALGRSRESNNKTNSQEVKCEDGMD
jgi:hypothetical protein